MKGIEVDLVTISIGNRESILMYLPTSDGKAISISPSDKISPLYFLTDYQTGNQLFFEKANLMRLEI